MALLECPDCSRQVSDAAVACPNCGRPASELDRPSLADIPKTWLCQHCGSADIKKFSAVYEQSTSVTKAGGAAIGSVGIGVGGGRGVTVTQLGKRTAPPEMKQFKLRNSQAEYRVVWGCMVAPSVIIVFLGAGLINGTLAVLLIIGAAVAVRFYHPKQEAMKAAFEEAVADWDRKYVCMKCGTGHELVTESGEQKLYLEG